MNIFFEMILMYNNIKSCWDPGNEQSDSAAKAWIFLALRKELKELVSIIRYDFYISCIFM